MQTHANGRLNKTHLTQTLPVAPVTRAIRAALAISATLLALGGSGTAIAQGTCTFTTPTTVTCEGAFTSTLPDPSLFTPVTDLTLVLGDSANSVPTSVSPTAGLMGIDANWGGSVGVTSYADITTVGATGIFAYSATTATANNQGSITTNVTAAGAKAMDVNAYGDVSVVNNGAINAYSTGVYDVTAVNANSTNGNSSVDNQAAGTITASAQDGNAVAVNAYAFGAATVTNEGSITASTVNGYAAGIVAQAVNGNASVTNSGSITATSTNYQAVGILATSDNGYTTVINSGSVTATGGQDQTIGIEAYGALGATVQNTGNVAATSSYGEAIGIQARAYSGTASVNNGGTITSTSSSQYQPAIGVLASSINGPATVTNSGYVRVIDVPGLAVGLEAYSEHGNSSITNAGYVLAGTATGSATGVLANSVYGNVSVTNNAGGNIRSVATTGVPVAYGVGSYGIGISAESTNGDANVSNAGTVYGASLHGTGIGILAHAGGNVYVDNAASGYISSVGAYYGNARGIDAQSTHGSVVVTNEGYVKAFSVQLLGNFPKDISTVIGIKAVGGTGVGTGVSVTNTGTIHAYGPWNVDGIYTGSYNGSSITNAATGKIYAGGILANGISAVETKNTAAGLGVGDVSVDNAGSIRVVQRGSLPPGFFPENGAGIYALSSFGGDISVTNSGRIAVDTQHWAEGIQAYGFVGKVTENNSGSIVISGSGTNGLLFGEHAITAYSVGGVNVVNSGDITITTAPVVAGYSTYSGVNSSYGIKGFTGREGSRFYHGGGDAILLNTGHITINSDESYGMFATSQYGTAMATNAGDITLNGFSSVGISVSAGNSVGPDTGLGAIADNSGTISATGTNVAIGLRADTSGNSANVPFEIVNSGDVTATAQVRAQGVLALAFNNEPVTIDNSGSIYANAPISTRQFQYHGARGNSVGVHTSDYYGNATVTNSGSIAAVTQENNQAPGSASGVFMDNGYSNAYHPGFGNSVLDNTGSFNASLISSNGLQAAGKSQYTGQLAFGPGNTATGILAASTYGDVALTNAGTVSASAQSDHYAGGGVDNGVTTANGISAVSFVSDFKNNYGNTFTAGDIAVNNSLHGTIAATAESSDASGDTAKVNGISALVSVGSYGASLVSAGHGIAINNAGTISATALIANDLTGLAIATGISAVNGTAAGYANVTNTGLINATATTTGAAAATGIFASGYSVAMALNAGGTINATASGTSGSATGLSLTQTGTALLTTNNDGVLNATFVGAGQASGASITSAGDITFSNTNVIQANNATSAVGVAFNSPTNVTLTNGGTITANSAATGSVAVLSTGASNTTITNDSTGVINGAIQTGAGNDSLSNAGIWNAVGASDFGAGDDTITNTGTIHLNNTTISLGSDPAGNQFTNTNTGVITVLGNNTITMSTGTPVNPNPFTNNGTINFQNGAANNTLTIAGNFAGNGQLDMDVDGANGTGDKLKINGNVVAGSVNTVNVNLLSDPTKASTMIPLVLVSGTSAANAFVLGTFSQPKSFLGLSEAIVSTPNTFSLGLTVAAAAPPPPVTPPPPGTPPPVTPPPVTPPPVSIGVTVNGLSQLGTLAASAAPGVQSLMNSQIGTLEDRMGAVTQTIKGGLSLWTRAFADSGTVSPDHSAGNFGQNGNFAFDQSNSGEEVGLDFAISDEFKAGALFAKSQANQSLDGNEADSSKITGNTAGVYGTWISTSGFYVDASYRWMSFNDRLHAPTGYASIHGNADAFNVEVGKTWTLSNGLQIAPQFQYTLTKVDNINAQTGTLAGFQSTGDDASRARLGVMFSKEYTPASSNAVWMPYASISAVQELDGKNSYAVNNTFFGETNTKGTSVLAETGVNVQFGKLAVFGGLNWQDGGALKSFFGGQVGLRYTF